jgi:hypothetical protein
MGDWFSLLESFTEAKLAYANWQFEACADVLQGDSSVGSLMPSALDSMSWGLPEVSLELARFAQIGDSYRPIAVKRLAWQWGALSYPAVQSPYLRRLRGIGLTDVRGPYQFQNNVTKRLVSQHEGFTVLQPCPGLFQDLLPDALYPHEHKTLRPHLRIDIFDEAIFLLMQDDVLNIYIKEAVPYIILVPALPIKLRQSFNCRLTYPGAIFIGHRDEACDVAADIIHEFLHQLLWLSAWHRPEEWYPIGSNHIIRSPITGRDKDAAVMVHACIIYALIYHFRFLIGLQSTKAIEFLSASKDIFDQLMNVPELDLYPSTMNVLGVSEQCRSS